jgi:hypothetical protein
MKRCRTHFSFPRIAVALFLLNPLHGEPVQLVNKAGKEIRAEILSATQNSVVLHRVSDGKSFTLKVSDLSDESQKLVAAWRMDQPPPLTKEVSVEMPLNNSTKKRFLAFRIKLPEGEFNYNDNPESTGISFKHKDGTLSIEVIPHDLSKKEIEEELERVKTSYQKDISRDLLRLTPDRRKKLEPLSYTAFEKHGEFEGYFVARAGHQHCLGGEWTLIGKEFKLFIDALPMYKTSSYDVEIGPFRRKNIPNIISTIIIEEQSKKIEKAE